MDSTGKYVNKCKHMCSSQVQNYSRKCCCKTHRLSNMLLKNSNLTFMLLYILAATRHKAGDDTLCVGGEGGIVQWAATLVRLRISLLLNTDTMRVVYTLVQGHASHERLCCPHPLAPLSQNTWNHFRSTYLSTLKTLQYASSLPWCGRGYLLPCQQSCL